MIWDQVVDENLNKILSWTIKKTGNRPSGEDLAQEVFVQFYEAVTKANAVEKPENLLWKVAHYWGIYGRRIIVARGGILSTSEYGL